MRVAALLFLASVALPAAGSSQIFSPGRLSEPHADLEGIRSCTSCHQLGRAGTSPDRCLACHTPLAVGLDRAEGLHASFEEPDCGTCHKEHLGREFDVRRFDESSFDHDLEAFGLSGGHQSVDCRGCHTDQYISDVEVREFKQEHQALDRTFLGLAAACAACHSEDEPHGGQFTMRDCGDCHDAGRWEEAVVFDHAASAYPLEGAHRNVDCASCHESDTEVIRYSPLPFAGCQTCHSDPHENQMAGECESCHAVDGWGVLSEGVVERTLDHDRTNFALRGAHAPLACESCHASAPIRSATIRITYRGATRGFTYPHPESEECASCHVDAHESQLSDGPTGGDCVSCHGEAAWQPTRYGLARHADAEFALTGAHETAPCVACHGGGGLAQQTAVFRFANTECATCHAAEDPHEDDYDAFSCDVCHSTVEFLDAEVDHAAATLSAVISECATCHTDDDPHGQQFAEVQCSECHLTEAFDIESFDHNRTRWPLDGAHVGTECSGCHFSEPTPEAEAIVRYRPLDTECAACHAAGTVN